MQWLLCNESHVEDYVNVNRHIDAKTHGNIDAIGYLNKSKVAQSKNHCLVEKLNVMVFRIEEGLRICIIEELN